MRNHFILNDQLLCTTRLSPKVDVSGTKRADLIRVCYEDIEEWDAQTKRWSSAKGN